MKRALLLLLVFLSVSLLFLSCGYSSPSSSSSNTTGVQNRAFVSQDVSGGNVIAGVNIVDDHRDILSLANVINAGATPGMMVVTPNRNQTLVFSRADHALSIINNAAETNAAHTTLPGATQSIVLSPDSLTAYVAVPAAQVRGQSPGAVLLIGMSNGAVNAQLDIPAAKFLAINHSGNRVLAFSDSPVTTDPRYPTCTLQAPCFVFVITPSNIGTNTNPVVPVPDAQPGDLDHPVAAFFSNDDNTAYIVNCGANCAGSQASVQTLDMTSNTPGTAVSVPAAESATIVGTTMYLAGTPVPASPCTGQKTQATSCGLLSIFDLTSMTVTNSNIVITDGNHGHIAMGANGQLFVGANSCTEITPTPQNNRETRGCLSIYNTQTGAVVIPPAGGDVTGLQPIASRSVVYLVQNGELQIYDTNTDKLQPTQIDISGEAVDVVAVDQ